MQTHSVLSRFGAVMRRLRRLRGTLGSAGLALALVAGQGGALLHELSHYQAVTTAGLAPQPGTAHSGSQTAASTDPSQPAPQDHGSKVCDVCLAFAQLAGALHSDPFVALFVVELGHRAEPVDTPVVVAVATPAPRSRGPPSHL